jgi:hypothetical protein
VGIATLASPQSVLPQTLRAFLCVPCALCGERFSCEGLNADVLLLKQILKRRTRIVRTRAGGRRGFFFARHANFVQRTVIASILFRDPLFHRLHALEAAAGIEIRALLARVQFKPALRTLAFP